jgi:hypothetical protein
MFGVTIKRKLACSFAAARRVRICIWRRPRKKEMNLTEIIKNLYIEKAKVEKSIEALETLNSDQGAGQSAVHRRGRKSMGAEERGQVSERMKRYWAARREQRAPRTARGSN